MKVQFSEKSWHYRLQQFVYNCPRKNPSLCPYFWNTVFAVILFPMALIGFVVGKYVSEDVFGFADYRASNAHRGFGSFAAMVVLSVVLGVLGTGIYAIGLLCMQPLGALVLLGVVALIGLIISAIFTAGLWIPYLESFKDMVCPIIYWKD